MSERTGVAIVGGGMTGLALGHHLSRAGVPHVVLEASSRVGGVVRSGHVDGHLLEWGPQRTRLTTGILELIDDLGLADEVVTAPPDLPLYVYRDGKLRRVPFSVADFLRTDLVSHRDKLPLLLEPFRGRARPEETVANYFTRKLGRPLYENLAGPLYGGLYASDPADMIVGLSLGKVLAEFRVGRSLVVPLLRRGGRIAPPAACSFRDGLEVLPRALQAANAASVRLDSAARSLRAHSCMWEVETDRGVIEADRVVITTPAPVAAGLLRSAGVDAASLTALRYNPLAVVHLHASTGIRGLGYQVGLGEALLTRGVTFNDSLFDRHGVHTAYLGGARAPEVVGWSNERIASRALDEFRLVTGADARVLSVERERMPAWDESWAGLAAFKAPPGLHLAANWESRPGLPGRLAQARLLAARFETELLGGFP